LREPPSLGVGQREQAVKIGDEKRIGKAADRIRQKTAQIAQPIDRLAQQGRLQRYFAIAPGPLLTGEGIAFGLELAEFGGHIAADRLEPPPPPYRIDEQQPDQRRGRRHPDMGEAEQREAQHQDRDAQADGEIRVAPRA
jgi:hypothetical protein